MGLVDHHHLDPAAQHDVRLLTGLARLVDPLPGHEPPELDVLGKDGALYLVDMPGYGYARAAKTQVKGWTRLIGDTFRRS